MTSRSQLRHRLRTARRALPKAQRHLASRRMALRCRRLGCWQRARHIAIYQPCAAEMDPLQLLTAGTAKKFYTPVVQHRRNAPLTFAPLGTHYGWHKSALGIKEPLVPKRYHLKPGDLDLVIVPLLGFDDACNRIGQGGGYYDRSFAFRLWQSHTARPRLVGVAYECQRVDTLQQQAWDVALDAVVTQRRVRLRPATPN